MTTDAQAMEALDSLSADLSKAHGLTLGLGSFCETYASAKPKLLLALTLIDRIPVYGKKIGDAVRLLMSLADLACKKA